MGYITADGKTISKIRGLRSTKEGKIYLQKIITIPKGSDLKTGDDVIILPAKVKVEYD